MVASYQLEAVGCQLEYRCNLAVHTAVSSAICFCHRSSDRSVIRRLTLSQMSCCSFLFLWPKEISATSGIRDGLEISDRKRLLQEEEKTQM